MQLQLLLLIFGEALYYLFALVRRDSSFRRYDKSVNIFSSEGELLQVQYAKEASMKGDCVIALRLGENDILICISNENISSSFLLDRRAVKKVSKIDKDVWIGFSGLAGDGNALVKRVREFAIQYFSSFGSSPSPHIVAAAIGEMQHEATLIGGCRPYGVSVLTIGYNEFEEIFEIYLSDPAGEVTKWNAVSIGKDSDKCNKRLELIWNNELSIDKTEEWIKNIFTNNNIIKPIEFYHFSRNKDSTVMKNYYK